MEILYTVRADIPSEHRARFSIDLEGISSPALDLVLPSWVPGSYVILNYSRGFRDLVARTGPNGAPLPTARVEKSRWRIQTEGASRVHVEYTVYGHQMVTEGFDFTPDHLFVNAALCLPYVDGHLSDPVAVTLDVPPEWTVITELEEVERTPRRYRARNYDELVDSPIDAGRPVVLTVRPSGIPHRICLCGEGGNYDAHTLEQDISKIVEAAVALVGDSPLSRYTFFYHLTNVPDGGLEHAFSTSCVVSRNIFRPAEAYRHFLSLTAHEYLHLYNVKRIRPKVLGPFDYTRENYTRMLWWMEGTTDYFTGLVLRRAGLASPDQYLEVLAKLVKEYLETPGRNRISLEESSLITWIDHYQPFEETPNQSVSYYLKGHLVSMCLDLEIRHQSETRASLETVLRLLWNEYGKVGRGLEEGELLSVGNRATGLDLSSFFDRFVRGTEEVDLALYARYAGLVLAPKAKRPDEADEPEPGDLGVAVEDFGGLARVRHSFVGRPGRAAGLTPGDEIIAINGAKVTYGDLEKMLEKCPPGTPTEITVFRRGYLHRVSLTTGARPPRKYSFTPEESPSELARKVYESWMGTKWVPRTAP
ncbi:MAG: PDZ domain-containing protein [Thermoplasmata archaeon]|jgi:predicted metalloprotease with PDZ domain